MEQLHYCLTDLIDSAEQSVFCLQAASKENADLIVEAAGVEYAGQAAATIVKASDTCEYIKTKGLYLPKTILDPLERFARLSSAIVENFETFNSIRSQNPVVS